MANDAILNSLWSDDYARGRREAEEMLTPEEKMVNEEEKVIWKNIEAIYLEQGIENLTDYFFSNLKFRKMEVADIILEFCRKISKIPLKIPRKIEKRLIRETQMGNIYTMRLGQTLFGRDKFLRMVNNRV